MNEPRTEFNSGSANARAAILNRVRAANSDLGRAVDLANDYRAIPRTYVKAASLDRAAILTLFTEQLLEYDAIVHEAVPSAVCAIIEAVLATNNLQSATVSAAVPAEWLPENVRRANTENSSVEELDHTASAIVACEVAIAHTGTIILRDARRISLLPDRLLAIVRDDQVVETVPEAFARLQELAASALTFVSGPSATADIEMTRIRGVHGPRSLEVILVRSRPLLG